MAKLEESLKLHQTGEQPPAKEPLPPTPSPQRELLKAMLTAHHYSYDEQGNIVPQYPQQTETPPSVDRGDKASNQAREDHAKRRAANPYLQPPGARPRTTQAAAATDTLTADPTHAKAQQPLQQFPARGTTHGDSQPSSTKALPKAHRSPPHASQKLRHKQRQLRSSSSEPHAANSEFSSRCQRITEKNHHGLSGHRTPGGSSQTAQRSS